MLQQLHWQFKNGTTEMRAQQEISTDAEMKAFWKETKKRHPLPEGAQWLLCDESSEHFVWVAA